MKNMFYMKNTKKSRVSMFLKEIATNSKHAKKRLFWVITNTDFKEFIFFAFSIDFKKIDFLESIL